MTRLFSFQIAALILCLSLTTACQRDAPAPVEERSTATDVSVNADTDVLEASYVASSGDLHVTLEEYERSIRRAQLSGPPFAEKVLADPSFQRSRLTRLLGRARVEQLASERDIVPTPEQLLEAAKRHPRLQSLDTSSSSALATAVEKELGVTADDSWHFMREDAQVHLLTEVLLLEIDDDELRRRYQILNTAMSLKVVRIPNVASSAEITSFVKTRTGDVDQYYRSHREDYRTPPMASVRYFEIRVPLNAPPADVERLRETAEEFRLRCQVEDFGTLAEAHSTDPITAPHGGRMPPIPKHRLPLAFEVGVGNVSELQKDRKSFWFILVEGRTEAVDRTLEPALQREIASKLIQAEGMAPSVRHRATAIRDAWHAGDEAAFQEVLDRGLFDRYDIENAPNRGDGRLPQLGRVPRLIDTIAAVDVGEVSEPILDGKYIYIARVTNKTAPDPVRFQAEKDLFRKQQLDLERPRILWQQVNVVGENAQIDLRAIQERFGVLQSDGTVAPVGNREDEQKPDSEGDPG